MIIRPKLNLLGFGDWMQCQLEEHVKEYGDGIFLHPEEAVGCMYGQLRKLSESADTSLLAFKERCRKTLMGAAVAYESARKLIEIKESVSF